MAHIPSIKRSLAPLPQLKKRSQTEYSHTEEIREKKPQISMTERRFRKDRRIKNIKMLFDRRKSSDRRNKRTFNHRKSGAGLYDSTGQMIDTTA